MNTLAELLSSRTRAEVFRLLFGLRETPLHLHEMKRQTGLAVATVRQELKRLARLGLVVQKKDGNRTYYTANPSHPLFPEVRALVLKTCGLADTLRNALRAPEIRCAFVFGSLARGEASPESDLDLMVIGNLGLRRVTALLSGVGTRVGREINPHVFTPAEFSHRRRAREHFVATVMDSPRLFLVGSEHELEAMAG